MIELLTARTVLPITADEAKKHLVIEPAFVADDTYIESLIHVATSFFEKETGRVVMQSTHSYTLNNAQKVINIPRFKITSISSVVFISEDGTEVPATDYFSRLSVSPAVVVIRDSPPEKTILTKVTFVAGVATANLVPDVTKHAIKFLVAHLYENREVYTDKAAGAKPLPFSLAALIAQQTITRYV